jgi:periplasmic copper chaperone A
MNKLFMNTSIKVIFLGIILFVLSACGPKTPNISIHNAWVRPDPLWENAAGYFVIENSGNENDALIGITIDFADSGMMHQTTIEDDISKMVMLMKLDVPAGESVEFKPMNYHVMITNLQPDLNYGDIVTITFEFETSGIIEVAAELRKD